MKNRIEFEEEIINTDKDNKINISGVNTIDPTNLDSLYTKHIFRVEDDNYKLEKDVFKILFPCIQKMKHTFLENKVKIYILPRETDKSSFEIFLNLIGVKNFKKFNFVTTIKLLNISVFFKYEPLIELLLEGLEFDKNNCLKVIREFIKKLDDIQLRPLFLDTIQKAVDVSAKNIFFLINNKYQELMSLSLSTLEEIIEFYFESQLFNKEIDNSLVFKILMQLRDKKDIFELLENERKKSIATFEGLVNSDSRQIEPSIIWKIEFDNTQQGEYIDSGDIKHDRIIIQLINYYDPIKDVCSIAIKIKDVLCEDNIKQSQHIISLLSICEIPEINLRTKINFNCIFSNLKTKVLICKIESFSKFFKKFDKVEYNLHLYFSLSWNFSALLTHICKNFLDFYTLESLQKLSKNVLSIILKNENLKIKSEDDILEACTIWVKNKENADIFKSIRWSNISLDGMIDFLLNESKLLANNQEVQNLVINEFSRRFKEEYVKEINISYVGVSSSVNHGDQMDLKFKKSQDFNLVSSNNNTETVKKGFTSEFIGKLIKIASILDEKKDKKEEKNFSKVASLNNINLSESSKKTKKETIVETSGIKKDSTSTNSKRQASQTKTSLNPKIDYFQNLLSGQLKLNINKPAVSDHTLQAVQAAKILMKTNQKPLTKNQFSYKKINYGSNLDIRAKSAINNDRRK